MNKVLEARVNAWRPKAGVINSDMIRFTLTQMIKDGVPGNNIDEEEGYEFSDVTHLHLEHLDILHIDHLWMLSNLTVLKLTGNCIEKIENLNALIHLENLNLSFNKISVIENLDNLIKLTHLSLFSNQVRKIENLTNLNNLKIFTIGNNMIEDRMCILQLRKINLFSLNMAGNPCAKAEDFRLFMAAYVPKLEYYDYKKITKEEKVEGRTLHLEELEFLERAEREEEKVALKAKTENEVREQHLQAFVEDMDDNQLYEKLLTSDPNGQALLLIGEDVEDIFKKFEQDTTKCSIDLFNVGMEQMEVRQKEIEMFNVSMEDAISKSQEKQRECIEQYLSEKNNILLDVDAILENGLSEEIEVAEKEVGKVYQMCSEMKKELMTLELVLSDQLQETLAQFERSVGDMVNSFIETAQGFFTNMRENEVVLSEQLGDHAMRFISQLLTRNEDITSLPPLLRPIMEDKDSVSTAVATCHDAYLQMIDTREDQLISRTRNWYQKLCNDYEQNEEARFRRRIDEIIKLFEIQARELQEYVLTIKKNPFYLIEEGGITG